MGVTCPTQNRGRRETCQILPLLLEILLGSPYGASRCLMSLALKEIRWVEGPVRFPGRAEAGCVAKFSGDMESLTGKEDVSLDVTSSAEPNWIIAGDVSSSSTHLCAQPSCKSFWQRMLVGHCTVSRGSAFHGRCLPGDGCQRQIERNRVSCWCTCGEEQESCPRERSRGCCTCFESVLLLHLQGQGGV